MRDERWHVVRRLAKCITFIEIANAEWMATFAIPLQGDLILIWRPLSCRIDAECIRKRCLRLMRTEMWMQMSCWHMKWHIVFKVALVNAFAPVAWMLSMLWLWVTGDGDNRWWSPLITHHAHQIDSYWVWLATSLPTLWLCAIVTALTQQKHQLISNPRHAHQLSIRMKRLRLLHGRICFNKKTRKMRVARAKFRRYSVDALSFFAFSPRIASISFSFVPNLVQIVLRSSEPNRPPNRHSILGRYAICGSRRHLVSAVKNIPILCANKRKVKTIWQGIGRFVSGSMHHRFGISTAHNMIRMERPGIIVSNEMRFWFQWFGGSRGIRNILSRERELLQFVEWLFESKQ